MFAIRIARFQKIDFFILAAAVSLVAMSFLVYTLSKPKKNVTFGHTSLLRTEPAGFIDLGDIGQLSSVPFTLGLVNTGQKDVVIRDVSLPCSCTKIGLHGGDRVLAKTTTPISGEIDTRGRRGPYEITIGVSYHDDSSETFNPGVTVLVPIRMNIVPTITVSRSLSSTDNVQRTVFQLSSPDTFCIESIVPSSTNLVYSTSLPIRSAGKMHEITVEEVISGIGGVNVSSARYLEVRTNCEDERVLKLLCGP